LTKPDRAWLLSLLPGAEVLDVALPGNAGVDRAALIKTPTCHLVAKRLGLGNSTITRLPEADAERLFTELHQAGCGTIVAPVPVAGRFVHRRGDEALAFFPLVGSPAMLGKRQASPTEADLLAAARGVAVDLAAVSPTTRQAFRNASVSQSFDRLAAPEFLAGQSFATLFAVADVTPVLSALKGFDAATLDHLAHGDFHNGNVVRDETGKLRVIDLDSLQLASPAADLLKLLIWRNADETLIARETAGLEAGLGRALSESDGALAMAAWIFWYEENLGRPFRRNAVTPRMFETGLTAALTWFRARWRPDWS
jgi:Phosphotransferase enzyme family